MHRFCESLHCRHVLMVGDSTMGVAFQAITSHLGAWDDRYEDVSWHAGKECSDERRCDISRTCPPADQPAIRESFTLCANRSALCPRGINISYWRHDHLQTVGSRASFAHNASNCDGWERLLENGRGGSHEAAPRYDLAIISRGAHLNEYEGDLKASKSFHSERADSLGRLLRKPQADGATIVYLKATWGHPEPSTQPGRPLDDPPEPALNHSWHLIPLINEVTASRLLRARLDHKSLIVLDPTRAISMRADCRNDALHLHPDLLLGSTWRLVQNALRSLHTVL